MRCLAILLFVALTLSGCREVRVNTYAQGSTSVLGPHAVVVVRSERQLEEMGIRQPLRFSKEFGVVLLMGPHKDAGWRQVIESIRANNNRVRIVAYEKDPFDSGDPAKEYRTYTIWIVPNGVYRKGSIVDVVTPSGDPIATTVLR